MLFKIVSENKKVDWGTYPTFFLIKSRLCFLKFLPSINTLPIVGSKFLTISSAIVDFPVPTPPRIPSDCPFLISKLKLFSALILVSSYSYVTCSNLISPKISYCFLFRFSILVFCFKNSLILFWDASAC